MILVPVLCWPLLLVPVLPCRLIFAQGDLLSHKQGLDGPPPIILHLWPLVQGLGPPLIHGGGLGFTLAPSVNLP